MPEFPPTMDSLLLDQSFVNHCLNRDDEARAYWKAFEVAHPEYMEVLETARQSVLAMYAWGQSEEMEEQWGKLQEMISPRVEMPVQMPQPLRPKGGRGWRIALAVGAAAAAAGIWILPRHRNAAPTMAYYVTVSAPARTVRECGLPDGSRIWLDAGSTIKYRADSGQGRNVTLVEGQIFCRVHHDSAHPFSVHTPSGLEIRDIGTAFAVQSYHGLNKEMIKVAEGEVSVQEAGHDLQLLQKDQGISLDVASGALSKLSGASTGDTSWISGSIALNDVSLKELAIVLERTYDLHITFTAPALMTYRASSSFRRTDPPKDVLEALKLVYGITYTLSDHSVVLGGASEHR